MEKQVTFELPARKVEGEIVDVYENKTALVRYVDYYGDDIRVLKDVTVPVDSLKLE